MKAWKKDKKGGVEIIKLTPEQRESLTAYGVKEIPSALRPKKLYGSSAILNFFGNTDEPSWFHKLGGYREAVVDWILVDRATWFLIGAIIGAAAAVMIMALK